MFMFDVVALGYSSGLTSAYIQQRWLENDT
jgi:hypothetical protein